MRLICSVVSAHRRSPGFQNYNEGEEEEREEEEEEEEGARATGLNRVYCLK